MADFDMVDDDVILPEDKQEAQTALTDLQAELKRVISNPPLTLAVPSRPNMSLVFDTNLDAELIQKWRKACHDRHMQDEFDGLKFSCIIIANKCTAVIYNGAIATDADDRNLTFGNRNFLEMLGAARSIHGVRKVYANDGHIFTATDAILTASGYNSEGQEIDSDPTLLD